MKRIATLALAVVLALGLAACGDGNSQAPSYVPTPEEMGIVSSSVPEPEPEPEQEPAFEMGILRMPQKWAHDSEGIAFGIDLSPLPDEQYILLRADFETLEQTPFCHIEGCPHNGASCAAYKPAEAATAEIYSMANGYFVMHDELIIIRQYEPTRGQHKNFTIERLNPEGTAREVFVEIPGRLYAIPDTIITDDQWLFMDVYNYEETPIEVLGLAPEARCLMRVDLETGDFEKLRDLPRSVLLGYDGDALLIRDYNTEPAVTVAWRPQYDTETELPPMPDAFDYDDFNNEEAFYGGCKYYVRQPEGENARLLGWRVATGEVAADVGLPHGDCQFMGVVDGYLEARDSGDYYFVNLDTGEVITPPLLAENGDGEPAHIEAVLGDDYIVTSGYRTVVTTIVGNSLEMRSSVFSRISKADYWAGAPNYTPMSMWEN